MFVAELFRRKVIRLVGAYIVTFWALGQGYASFYTAFGLPDWTLRAFIITGIAITPIFAWFSWKYDITPPQLVRDVKDVEAHNPGLSWAMRRHGNADAGFILLKWYAADDRVSCHHAVLWAQDGAWRVRDLDSGNGTFLNRAAVDGSAVLPQSCELRFHANGPTIAVHVDKPAATRIT